MNWNQKLKECAFLGALCLAFACLCPAYAKESSFSRGESLFKQNRTEEAIPFFKQAVSEGGFPKAYIYLALCYEKAGMLQESLDTCTEGMKVSGTDKKVLAFNAGNVCYAMEDYGSAEKWYSLAAAANRLYAPPVLNRANARLKQEKYLESLEDYKLYLDLSPNDKQKPQIEQIIALLEGVKKAEEERLAEEQRLREEEALIMAAQRQQLIDEQKAAVQRAQEEERNAEQQAALEQQRAELEKLIQEQKEYQEAALQAQREEAARKAEADAARRRKLLEDVAESLQNSEASNMSAGAEGTVDYGYESELE